MEKDYRIRDLLHQLARFSSGDFTAITVASGNHDDIDAIIEQTNALGKVLRTRADKSVEAGSRINTLVDVLTRYRMMDFSRQAPAGESDDDIDRLAAEINMLGEALAHHTAKHQDNEEKIETIFRNAPDAVIVINSAGVVVRWNPAAEVTFGWREQEVTGKLLHTLIIPERYRLLHVEGLKRFLATGKGPMLNKTVQLPALRRDKSEIAVELTISPARLKDEYLFVAFLRDATEQIKVRDEIRQLNTTLEQRVVERTEQLHQSERKYRNLFENNPMPMWILELPTLRFLDVNEAAVRQYGYSRQEFLSMTAVDIRPEEDKKKFIGLDRSATGPHTTGIWKHLRKDGSMLYAEVSVHEITVDGKPARLVLSSDVTERKKAEEALRYSEARFRRIFESKLIGFIFWSSAGEILEANDVFLDMIGYSRQDLAAGNIRWNEITPPEYAPLDQEALWQIEKRGICEPFEKEYIRKDGSRLPVLIGVASLEDYKPDKGIAYIMDVSQRKKMKEEILELNRNLEQRVAARTEELQLANKELESFSYSVSHDLRAPLRAIHGFSQMLQEDYESRLDAEGMRLLNNVKYNARRMGQLIDDLLTFSRLGKGELNQSIVDVNDIVADVLRELRHAGNEEAKINVQPLGEARADANLLRHVFQNLIHNAVKYSAKKDNPVIEIGVTKTDGIKTYFVRDNGAGFDMAYYNKLFGVFQRLHRQEEFEGTGVGLAIVQRIISRHDGRIWAEGKVNEGATFYFTLGGQAGKMKLKKQ